MSVATLQCQLKKSKNLLGCKIVYKKEGIGLLFYISVNGVAVSGEVS